MIYLTRTGDEKTKFLINHRLIQTIEKNISGTSNVYMENGKVFTVLETDQEIKKKIEVFEIEIIKNAIQLARKV